MVNSKFSVELSIKSWSSVKKLTAGCGNVKAHDVSLRFWGNLKPERRCGVPPSRRQTCTTFELRIEETRPQVENLRLFSLICLKSWNVMTLAHYLESVSQRKLDLQWLLTYTILVTPWPECVKLPHDHSIFELILVAYILLTVNRIDVLSVCIYYKQIPETINLQNICKQQPKPDEIKLALFPKFML